MDEIMIFLGSGASAPFGVPTMTGKDGMSYKFESDSTNLLTDDEEKLYKIIQVDRQSNDLERILGILDFVTKEPREIPRFFNVITNDLDLKSKRYDINESVRLLKSLKSKIFDSIKRNCMIDKPTLNKKKGIYEEFFNFLNKHITTSHYKIHPRYNIFTTNYDIIIDRYIKDKHDEGRGRFTYQDGFKIKNEYPEWSPEVYAEVPTFKLFKLHGSIDWYYLDERKIVKRDVKLLSYFGETIYCEKLSAAILYPVPNKEIYRDPFSELSSHLKDTLKDYNTNICIIVGYSFRDEYIKKIFFDAINRRKEKMEKMILIDKNPDEVKRNLSNEELELIGDKTNFFPIEGDFGSREVLDKLEKILS